MRALTLRNGRLNLETDAPEPVPGPGEVRIRVLVAGICETDLQLIRGYMNFEGTLGHEFVGVALEGRYQGQRVVGEINCPCGACETCRRGLGNHCPHRSVLGILNRHGAFADIVCLPEANLHLVPDDVPNEIAVFTEPVAAAFQIPAQITLDSKLSVIVLGDGRLGALCAQVVRLSRCRTQVIGKHDFKLDRLRSLGLETMRLDEVSGDMRADVVVDCTGSPGGIERALSLVRPRGTIVLKTTVADRPPLAMAPFVIDEVTLVGSRCGPFAPALKALRDGTVQVRPLISRSHSLDEWSEAFETARSPQALKVLLTIGSPKTS